MGFDPRDWPSGGRSSRPITGNLDALLQENAALKQEVLRLRRLLDRYERLEREPRAATAKPQWLSHSEAEHWARLLTQQPGWSHLRAGDEGHGLMGLIAHLNRSSFLPQLSLAQRLDRLAPGLGRDLEQALHGLNSKQQQALRAAFAVYGISAREWLADEPRRVVAELRQQCQRLDQRSVDTGELAVGLCPRRCHRRLAGCAHEVTSLQGHDRLTLLILQRQRSRDQPVQGRCVFVADLQGLTRRDRPQAERLGQPLARRRAQLAPDAMGTDGVGQRGGMVGHGVCALAINRQMLHPHSRSLRVNAMQGLT